MFTIITTLIVTLNSGIASAATAPSGFLGVGLSKFEMNSWKVTHHGRAKVAGEEVAVSLQESTESLHIGNGDGYQTVLPLAPSTKKIFRLVFTSIHNAQQETEVRVERKTASVDGIVTMVLLSERSNDSRANLNFMIQSLKDKSLTVKYNSAVEAELNGEFRLFPVFSRI